MTTVFNVVSSEKNETQNMKSLNPLKRKKQIKTILESQMGIWRDIKMVLPSWD